MAFSREEILISFAEDTGFDFGYELFIALNNRYHRRLAQVRKDVAAWKLRQPRERLLQIYRDKYARKMERRGVVAGVRNSYRCGNCKRFGHNRRRCSNGI